MKKTFLALGKQSTNMWLTHTFFCYYFYPAVKIVVVYPKYAILSLIVFVAFTYVASVLLDLFWKGLGIGYRKAKLLATGLGKKA